MNELYVAWSVFIIGYIAAVIPIIGGHFGHGYKDYVEDFKEGVKIHAAMIILALIVGAAGCFVYSVFWLLAHYYTQF